LSLESSAWFIQRTRHADEDYLEGVRAHAQDAQQRELKAIAAQDLNQGLLGHEKKSPSQPDTFATRLDQAWSLGETHPTSNPSGGPASRDSTDTVNSAAHAVDGNAQIGASTVISLGVRAIGGVGRPAPPAVWSLAPDHAQEN
jgi:hypothetical protein